MVRSRLIILKRTERGLRRILHSLGMLPDYVPDQAQGTRELNAKGSVYAYAAGLFEPLKSIGEDVAEGELVGLIHHPDTPEAEPDRITSPYARDRTVQARHGASRARRRCLSNRL